MGSLISSRIFLIKNSRKPLDLSEEDNLKPPVLSIGLLEIETARKIFRKPFTIPLTIYNGQSPLHVAIFNNQLKMAEFLLDKGANINARDRFGNTPLHYATNASNQETAELLVERGADVNAANEVGITPLHMVCFGFDFFR